MSYQPKEFGRHEYLVRALLLFLSETLQEPVNQVCRQLSQGLEEYQIIHSRKNFDKLREIGLDGGAEKFIGDLRAVLNLPPAISDRPHIEYIKLANQIRGWN